MFSYLCFVLIIKDHERPTQRAYDIVIRFPNEQQKPIEHLIGICSIAILIHSILFCVIEAIDAFFKNVRVSVKITRHKYMMNLA